MKAEAYPHYAEKTTAPRYLPDFSAATVLDIDFKKLHDLGVEHVLFDLDLTLRKHNAPELGAEVIAYLFAQRDAGAVKTLTLATNNIHNVDAFSKPLGAHVFQPFRHKGRFAHKPHKVYFDRIVRTLNVEPHTIAMIGDKVQFDVAGGNRAGMWTILVEPFGKDALHDQLLLIRWRHNRLLKRARQALALTKQLQTK